MTILSCRYFLAVCEHGSINAAARELYVSQQALSFQIRKLEEELGLPLFDRGRPLTLTQAGQIFRQTALSVTQAMDRLDRELNILKGLRPPTLSIGCLDYGAPDFLPVLMARYLQHDPQMLFQTLELMYQEPIPAEVGIVFASRKPEKDFACEQVLSDRLVVCVTDELLHKCYGDRWQEHRAALTAGDLHALDGCPFIHHENTPLEAHSRSAFEKNDFTPAYLPISGSIHTLGQLCKNGQAAMITLLGRALAEDYPPACFVPNMPDPVPAVYLCTRSDRPLTEAERNFAALTREYFSQTDT